MTATDTTAQLSSVPDRHIADDTVDRHADRDAYLLLVAAGLVVPVEGVEPPF